MHRHLEIDGWWQFAASDCALKRNRRWSTRFAPAPLEFNTFRGETAHLAMHPTLIHERVELARRGENPTVICRMQSGWAVLGDHQLLAGYSLLLPDPVVEHLTDLDTANRGHYLSDMALIGEALHACTDTFRINYEILGNGDAALHAHIFPRYSSEPDRYRRAPVWTYPTAQRTGTLFDPAVHSSLQKRLADYLGDTR